MNWSAETCRPKTEPIMHASLHTPSLVDYGSLLSFFRLGPVSFCSKKRGNQIQINPQSDLPATLASGAID